MRRIDAGDTPGASVDLFGSGNDGYTEGSPPGTPATEVSDLAMNLFQEEIVRAITNMGITLDQATTDVGTHNKEQLWRALISAGNSGPSMVWRPTPGNGAVEQYISGRQVFTFSPNSGQSIEASFSVGDRYVTTSDHKQQMDLAWSWFADDTSGDVDWNLSVELVNPGTDIDSPDDTSTPTVAAVTLASPSNKLQRTSGTIIDSDGEVNATDVAAGAQVKIVLSRVNGGTDTATVDAHIPVDSLEPKYI